MSESEFQGIDDAYFTKIVIGVLVEKLGGHVSITQADLDAVAYKNIVEDLKDGVFELRVYTRTSQ